MDAMVFSLTSIYLVTRGVLRGSPVAFAGGGIALGMCFYVYYTARLSLIVVFGIIMLGMLTRKGPLRWWAVRIGWLAAGALVTVSPLLAVYAQDPSAALARTDRVSLFSPQNFEFVQRTYKLERTDEVLRFQAQRALEMFNLPWDTSSQFGSKDPLLDPVSGVLFVVGCAMALARLFSFSHALLLGWLGLTLAGVTLTDGIPFSPRAVIALPAVIILASLGLSTVRDALQVTFNTRSRHLAVALCMLLVIVAGLNTSSYFTRYISKWHPAGFATTAGRLLASEKLPGPIVLVGGPEASRTIDIIRFLAPNAVYNAEFEPPYDAQGASFIVDARTPGANRVIAAISASIGDADRQPYRDPTGRLLFTVIRNRL